MSCEVLLSDEAKAEPLNDTAQSILERVAQSGELDHVLSAKESNFELRYQSLGNTYVFFRRHETERQVAVVYFCEMDVPLAAISAAEPRARILEMKTRDIPHGMEAETWVEKTRPDGSTVRFHHFARKIDMADSYMVLNHTPAGTFLITAKKGRVEGDFRHDELEMVHLHQDGTVQHFPANTVPVWIKNPYEGLSQDQQTEKMREWVHSPGFRQKWEAAQKWMKLG